MAEKYVFDAVAVQLGVAYGLLGGTAVGLLTGSLTYWMTLGTLTGAAIACVRHNTEIDTDMHDEEPRSR